MKRSDSKVARLLNGQQIRQNLERFCKEIRRQHGFSEHLAFIGIRTRGFYIARRLSEIIRRVERKEIPVGELDISLYRDDLNTLLPEGKVGATQIPFNITGKTIVLVDDVLNTGRTVRAAVDHLMDLGRPRVIHLAVLIDRGGRELPIAANFVGKSIKSSSGKDIRVRLKEVDGKDEVIISR
ncbi:MAG: bifunctional pyr operon transcriptional regulator/uracil phosphoribosyltransferase PyrR [Candidatus Binatia bacterium]